MKMGAVVLKWGMRTLRTHFTTQNLQENERIRKIAGGASEIAMMILHSQTKQKKQ